MDPDTDAPPAPPTVEARAYAADLLHRLSWLASTELDAGEVPVGDSTVVLVDLQRVEEWLDGCRTRLAAGANL